MKITSINLRNFRNIESLDLDFHPHLNIFVGDNGQGKTNILESITYLSSGRSFRVSQDLLMIQDGKDHAKIDSNFDNKHNISVVLSNQGKYMMHNQINITKLSDFIGICNVVLFNPDDLQFYTQAPRKRRREVDYELGKSSKTYLQNLLKVNRLVQDRNAFLKSNVDDTVYLEVIDQQIVQLSEYLIHTRYEFTQFISSKIEKYYNLFSNTNNKLKFEYEASIDLKSDNYKSALLQKMKESLRRDKDFKMTHVGIHRDDFVFKIDDVPVIQRMSQGQRRMLMIAFKLSIIDWFIEHDGVMPIFCMDDLFFELDASKRKLVLDNLNESLQIFITTTDLDFIQTNKDKHIFEIQSGKATRRL